MVKVSVKIVKNHDVFLSLRHYLSVIEVSLAPPLEQSHILLDQLHRLK